MWISPPNWVQNGYNMAFVSANGDSLKGTFVGVAYPFLDYGAIPLAGDGTYEIIEGTGRFERYTGDGTYFWRPSPDRPENYLEFNGTLTKP